MAVKIFILYCIIGLFSGAYHHTNISSSTSKPLPSVAPTALWPLYWSWKGACAMMRPDENVDEETIDATLENYRIDID